MKIPGSKVSVTTFALACTKKGGQAPEKGRGRKEDREAFTYEGNCIVSTRVNEEVLNQWLCRDIMVQVTIHNRKKGIILLLIVRIWDDPSHPILYLIALQR